MTTHQEAQRAVLREAIEDAAYEYSRHIVEDTAHLTLVEHMLSAFDAAVSTQPSEQATHPDDDAVDRFSAAMKEKLAQARAKGRGGWQECDAGVLSGMLREHVKKGDPRDVANFCMFLWSLGHGITEQSAKAAVPLTPVAELLAHIDDVLEDAEFEKIDTTKWNAVSSLIGAHGITTASPPQTLGDEGVNYKPPTPPHPEASKQEAQGGQVPEDEQTWAAWVAGVVGCYLGFDVDDQRNAAIAGIIQRRICGLRTSRAATPKPQAEPKRCANCDDTGYVHSFDGDWRGRCHCPAGSAQPQAEPAHSEDCVSQIHQRGSGHCDCGAVQPQAGPVGTVESAMPGAGGFHCKLNGDQMPRVGTPLYAQPKAEPAPSAAAKGELRELLLEIVGLTGRPDLQLAASALLAAPAAPQADNCEQYNAIREGHFNAASEEYFNARPQLDSNHNRRIFQAGHSKGYDAAHPTPDAPQADALDARSREQLAIGRAVERACELLPPGEELEIGLERGAGTVYHLDRNKGAWRYIDSGDTFSSRINQAIDAAIAAQEQEKP